MDDRRRALEMLSKRVQQGADTEDLFDIEGLQNQPMRQALNARDLTEEALAKQVLDNTGIPIPGKRVSESKVQDFLQRIVGERYPEVNSQVNFTTDGTYYDPTKKIIGIDRSLVKNNDIITPVAAALHEAGHGYDDQKLKYKLPQNLKTEENKVLQLDRVKLQEEMLDRRRKGLSDKAPMELYEMAAKGHHARIPNLRDADSYGLGALKSMLKSGTFKQVAGALPFAGTAAMLASGDASAAASELPGDIPVVGQAYEALRSENAGSSMDDREMQTEVKAMQNYDASPARRDALMKVRSGR